MMSLLDGKRAQNLGIFKSTFKMPMQEVALALNILPGAPGALTPDQVINIRKLAPTPEEDTAYAKCVLPPGWVNFRLWIALDAPVAVLIRMRGYGDHTLQVHREQERTVRRRPVPHEDAHRTQRVLGRKRARRGWPCVAHCFLCQHLTDPTLVTPLQISKLGPRLNLLWRLQVCASCDCVLPTALARHRNICSPPHAGAANRTCQVGTTTLPRALLGCTMAACKCSRAKTLKRHYCA